MFANIWSQDGDIVWEGHGPFRRWNLVVGTELLGEDLEVLKSRSTSYFLFDSSAATVWRVGFPPATMLFMLWWHLSLQSQSQNKPLIQLLHVSFVFPTMRKVRKHHNLSYYISWLFEIKSNYRIMKIHEYMFECGFYEYVCEWVLTQSEVLTFKSVYCLSRICEFSSHPAPRSSWWCLLLRLWLFLSFLLSRSTSRQGIHTVFPPHIHIFKS